ncbi:peptidoglycan-binding protein [Micromonospora sp. NPDC050397]|uniref:peptidoglycan-binding protein n=1 Tax=Micromonospora sp. NPDC050397 TaxID=3364279 RepID=UPI0038503D65
MSEQRRPARRLIRTVGIGLAVLALVAAAVVASVGLGGGEPEPGTAAAPGGTTPVIRETLVESAQAEADLGYGDRVPLVSAAPGTLTWLPTVGTTVNRGQPLLRADDKPVVLLYGTLPMYRQLKKDTEGTDVKQFETNLRELGYSGLTVDTRYTAATETAVKRWQKDLGQPETGTVEVNQVSYAAGPVRVAEHRVRLGASATGELLGYTGTEKIVTARVPVDGSDWAKAGVAVTVTLPGGATVPGTVTGVGAEVTEPAEGGDAPGGADAPTVPVTVRVADQAALREFEKAPVRVSHVVRERKDVLTVPVAALLALAEGGYGLELAQGSGTRMVAVEVGLIAAGRVEVEGPEITEGTTVVVPR